MKLTRLALCTYSYGIGNGIAHIDAALAHGLDRSRFSLQPYVLRADFPSGRQKKVDGAIHLSLVDAFTTLFEHFQETDIVQVNGALDPVVANAAAAAGVPAVVEVMHQVERGGLHPAIDVIACVSSLVHSVQLHKNSTVIYNGIDTKLFSFLPGRRQEGQINVVQIANAAKQVHWELGEIVQSLNDARIHAFTVGDRPSYGIPSLGPVRYMASVYRMADILFLLGKSDAFGLVFTEAMASGTLPVVSHDSGIAAFITSSQAGWVVNTKSRQDAVDTLSRAVNTVETAEFVRMQRRGRDMIVHNFGLSRMLEDYQRLYAELIGRPRKEPKEPGVWMDLALFAVLFRQGNKEAPAILERFNCGTVPLEPYFLRHPMGNATVSVVLQACPTLARNGFRKLVVGLCSRLRTSRVVSSLLDIAERL